MRERDVQKEIAIRDKALQLIVELGFDGFSMQRLAKAAGVSPATIYIYHRNREDLLNYLFDFVQITFSRVSLENFSPDMPLREGLWLQWNNRWRFIRDYPDYFKFYEQFRNSPLVTSANEDMREFRNAMKQFVINAIRRGEMHPMEPEVFWSLAYGPFYSLLKFHLQEKSMMNKNFVMNDDMLKRMLDSVVHALAYDSNHDVKPEHVRVFKTNVISDTERDRLAHVLPSLPGVKDWSIDMEDVDRVLRVVGEEVQPSTIIEAITNIGLVCHELE